MRGKLRCLFVGYEMSPTIVFIKKKEFLEDARQLIDGYVEIIRVDEHICMCCDEEGKLKNRKFNRNVETIYRDTMIPVVGQFLVCAYKEYKGFMDLTDAQITTMRMKLEGEFDESIRTD